MRPEPAILVVETKDPTPPYEQLRRQFVALISAGVLAPGERLPPVRQLAGDLGVAAGTVARAYRELEAAGLVHAKRGGGTRVSTELVRTPPGDLERLLQEHATAYIQHALQLGVARHAAVEAVRRAAAALGAEARGRRK